MPLILSEVLAVNDQHTTDTLTLRYTPTPQVASRFEKYRFQLASGGNSASDDGEDKPPAQSLIAEKLATDNEWKVTWQGLTPGRLYDITVWTVSAEGVLSQPLRRQDRLCKIFFFTKILRCVFSLSLRLQPAVSIEPS